LLNGKDIRNKWEVISNKYEDQNTKILKDDQQERPSYLPVFKNKKHIYKSPILYIKEIKV